MADLPVDEGFMRRRRLLDGIPERLARTEGYEYTRRLVEAESTWWKRVLDVQRPYRWNIAKTCEGEVLEIGCGLGRCLRAFPGRSVGVDHNRDSVDIARGRGLNAFTPEDFRSSAWAVPGRFDCLLLAHILEHLTRREADRLLQDYLSFLRPGGRIVMITPQERGFPTDPTHIRWVDFTELDAMSSRLGLIPVRRRSFPFPRLVGRIFPYNEFIFVSQLGSA